MTLLLALLLPFLTRGYLLVHFRELAGDPIPQEELDREATRQHISLLAGFSFTGAVAIAVLEKTLRGDFLAILSLLVASFLGFLLALNLQSYKALRWHNQLGAAAIDAGYLGMVIAVVSVVLRNTPSGIGAVMTLLGIAVWGIDHCIRLNIEWSILGGTMIIDDDDFCIQPDEDDPTNRNADDYQLPDDRNYTLNYNYCSDHRVYYPAGGTCPRPH